MGPQSQSPSSTFKVKGCLTSGGRFSPSKRDVPVLRFKKEREGGAAGTAAPAARRSQPAGWGWGAGSPRNSCRWSPLPGAAARQCRLGRLQPAPVAAPAAWLRKDGNAHR